MLNVLIDFSENMAILIAFTFIYGRIERYLEPVKNITVTEIIHGCLFAFIAFIGMQRPIELTSYFINHI